MFRCGAEYYNQIEPITNYEFRAWTKRGAIKKAFRYIKKINETVCYLQIWFKYEKIYGNGNKVLIKKEK